MKYILERLLPLLGIRFYSGINHHSLSKIDLRLFLLSTFSSGLKFTDIDEQDRQARNQTEHALLARARRVGCMLNAES
jgi:hypothetical protein